MPDDVLLLILGELRGIHATLRRQSVGSEARAALVAAIRDYFGDGAFTSNGIMEASADHRDLHAALMLLIDTNSDHAALALGQRLRHMPEIERIGDSRGAGLYRLRD